MELASERMGVPITELQKDLSDYEQLTINRDLLYNSQSGNLTGYNCAVCKNKGMIMTVIDGKEVMKQCECIKQRMIIKKSADYMKRYGIDFVNTTFDQYETPEQWQQSAKMMTQKFANDFDSLRKNWIYVGGQNGAGKTHLCTAICGILTKKQHVVHYENWKELCQRLESLRFESEYNDVLSQLQTVEVLFIDDLLKQKDKKKLPGDLNIAFEILDARYRSGKATVISSEWLIDDIFKMDAGLAGRIKQSAYLVQINYAENRDWRART